MPHEGLLSYLNTFVHPLIFHPNFPKKFFYINIILEFALKEVISLPTTASILAFTLVSNLFTYLPLPHESCLRNAYKKAMQGTTKVDYTDYLMRLKSLSLKEGDTKSSNEYYYHEMCNMAESRVCEVMDKILTHLEVREKPTKKGDWMNEYSQKVLDLAENMCCKVI